MPGGTIAVDTANTFSEAFYMSCAPKTKFGSDTGEVAVNSQGVPTYAAQVAVTWLPGPSGRVSSDVIQVTIAAPQDPCKDITPGSPVTFDRLRAGVMRPEAQDGGRVRGGTLYFAADGLRPAHAARKTDAA